MDRGQRQALVTRWTATVLEPLLKRAAAALVPSSALLRVLYAAAGTRRDVQSLF